MGSVSVRGSGHGADRIYTVVTASPWVVPGWALLFVGVILVVLALRRSGEAPLTDAQRTKLRAFQEAEQAARGVAALVAIEQRTTGPSQLPEVQRRLTAQIDALVAAYPEERDRVRIADANGLNGPDGLLATLDAFVAELTPKRPRGLRFPRRTTRDR